jgi:hypothetical protein
MVGLGTTSFPAASTDWKMLELIKTKKTLRRPKALR